ncbi:nucleotide exchange factor GrpE [Saccharospirillum salsuginis]|uniref:Protein GrpE n=1 Tax=Saccharospirillum salsuginis TaxID=418750 RepID=A0A918K8U5_9GAMM|nr:nucleotide exchange factor GrpE [Saccharospirillum salsuginis]GGX55253.1 protein GrpE [Saccharospirillum salsuginis]
MADEDKTVETQEDVQVDETAEQGREDGIEPEQDLAAELEAAREEIQSYKDQYLRSEAEMSNLRRRVEKDVENAHKFGQEKLVKEILTVADNLERTLAAIETDSDDIKPLKEGVEMTLKGLLDTFGKFSIEPIDPEGEPFDPQLHQAMTMVENPEVEPNTVISVMQKGYTLHGRLVRPAMVVVSKGGGSGKTIDETA